MINSLKYMDFGGFCCSSKSIGRSPQPFFSAKIKPLSQLGRDATIVMYGDEITPDFTDKLDVPWGDIEPETCYQLDPNCSYVWDIGLKTFTVTDDKNYVTVNKHINSISDLKITVDIFESHQFRIVISANYEPDIFLVATKVIVIKESNQNCYVWGQYDEYLNCIMHAVYGRLCNSLKVDGGIYKGVDISMPLGHNDFRTYIKALITDLSETGTFPNNLMLGEESISAKRQIVLRNALVAGVMKMLMIHMIAANLLLGSKPVFEPWMLWNMFKWLGGNNIVVTHDRIFDLSPWWGG